MKGIQQATPFAMVAVLLVTTGCAESAILVGNGASMIVASVLLWSTVNINRDGQGESP